MASNTENNLISGVFKTELKNRFLCTVCVDGVDVTCYIPSSCRLSNFIDLSGKTVLLKPNQSSSTRTAYAVYAVKYGRQYILLNLVQANRVIEDQLPRKYFSFLGKRKNVSREICIDDYKTDLFVRDTNTIIEIKSILSFEKSATFPSVYSERAVGQLKKLSKLLDAGYNVCYLFVSLNPRVKELCINERVTDYYNAFQECVNKGMLVRVFSLRMDSAHPEIHSRLCFKGDSDDNDNCAEQMK